MRRWQDASSLGISVTCLDNLADPALLLSCSFSLSPVPSPPLPNFALTVCTHQAQGAGAALGMLSLGVPPSPHCAWSHSPAAVPGRLGGSCSLGVCKSLCSAAGNRARGTQSRQKDGWQGQGQRSLGMSSLSVLLLARTSPSLGLVVEVWWVQ